jgi:oxygen-independent coproporphyrinogen-3 oxidase
MRPSISYALANLPRYTSYPTAPHFQSLDEASYREWLGEVRPDHALSLYIHIPFCASLCWYCGCHTAVTRSSNRIARYASGLQQEAALLQVALPAHAGIATLHLGGGTPTTLGPAGLRSLLAALRARFGFQPGAEIAAELDPRTLDNAMIDALAEAGVNRVSLGVQDIHQNVQRRIGRVQSEDSVAEAVAGLRRAGIQAINFDIMYGLPQQGVAEVEATARFAATQGATRVAVFGYAHVPWVKPHQNAIRTAELPGAEERLSQADAAEAVLNAAGYASIGLDHFARPADPLAVAAREGRLHRNFQGYTADEAPVLLGLGASSIGWLPRGYAQNEVDERRWLAAVEAGHLPLRRGRALTEEDRIRRDAIERVMCDLALDLTRLPPMLLTDALHDLRELADDGIITLGEGRLAVTQAGRRHVRHVAACFDAYLAAGAARHSRAV